MIPKYRQEVEEVVVKKTDDLGRQVWDIDFKIVDRQDKEEQNIQTRGTTVNLQARTEQLDIDNLVGKSRVINLEGPKKDKNGFYCELCDELATDSNSWLDHLNSKQHNRLLGMNMKVDKVNLSDVQLKLAGLKQANDNRRNQSKSGRRRETQENKKGIKEIKKERTINMKIHLKLCKHQLHIQLYKFNIS
ncbi:hypothetical protein pb186bvf_004802 [Paramecium bursaria]